MGVRIGKDFVVEARVQHRQRFGRQHFSGLTRHECPCSARRGKKHPGKARDGLLLGKVVDTLGNGGELLGDRHAVGGEFAHIARELLLQPGDPHHEKLVQVGRDDGVELEPLQKRYGLRSPPRRARGR